ncbi:forkhead box protein M1 isoform X3 [Hippocampus zosterae]|uniref:forkhead box protein M1 isoform X3 n=1 Tax=Hippocampus zosterae TaxID=109293 RepID=UPI00223CC1D1|nr:forkhead box protein M1 isoform X3 [Hippocampus zosterae]
MRRSPRRPLILKRRKLPFQQSAPPVSQDASQAQPGRSSSSEPFSDTVRVLDHPAFPGTQLVVIPKTAELRSVIEALTVKGKEHGAQGPNKFILLGQSGSLHSGLANKTTKEPLRPRSAVGQQESRTAAVTEVKQVKKDDDSRLFDDSLTNMQWLERCDAFPPAPADNKSDKENRTAVAALEGKPRALHSVPEAACGSLPETGAAPVSRPRDGASIKPPFSYMTMIQFAINSSRDGLLTLKEIYAWLQRHFDFFRDENRRGWKNSVRHNLSLHKMFIRKMSPDGKVSFWAIRPEANRGLTLDKAYTPGCNPVAAPVARPVPTSPHQQPTLAVAKKAPSGSAAETAPPAGAPLLPGSRPAAPRRHGVCAFDRCGRPSRSARGRRPLQSQEAQNRSQGTRAFRNGGKSGAGGGGAGAPDGPAQEPQDGRPEGASRRLQAQAAPGAHAPRRTAAGLLAKLGRRLGHRHLLQLPGRRAGAPGRVAPQLQDPRQSGPAPGLLHAQQAGGRRRPKHAAGLQPHPRARQLRNPLQGPGPLLRRHGRLAERPPRRAAPGRRAPARAGRGPGAGHPERQPE